MNLQAVFDSITIPHRLPNQQPSYAVRVVSNSPSYLIGRDEHGRACLLVNTWSEGRGRRTPSIRLSNLNVEFNRPCLLQHTSESSTAAIYSIIRCGVDDVETTRYFLWICETIIQVVGNHPRADSLSSVVIRLAAIFQRFQEPPNRSLIGLFGEIYVIWASADPVGTVSMWRQDITSRFDFSGNDLRLEVKTTTGQVRSHIFSYEQCNPPNGTVPVVASLLTEKIGSGARLISLLEDIVERLEGHPKLIFKLQEGVASSLGNTLDEALKGQFDLKLAEDSLKFFLMTDIPAIRGQLEAGVSEVHFKANLSACVVPTRAELLANNSELGQIMPSQYGV